MGKVKVIGGTPSEVEVFINGERVTQPIISITWRMDCDNFLPVLTIEMYADNYVEFDGSADIKIVTRES